MTYDDLLKMATKKACAPVKNRMTCSEYIKSKNLLGKLSVKEAQKEASDDIKKEPSKLVSAALSLPLAPVFAAPMATGGAIAGGSLCALISLLAKRGVTPGSIVAGAVPGSILGGATGIKTAYKTVHNARKD